MLFIFAIFVVLAGGIVGQSSIARAVDISAAIPGSNTISTSSSPGAYIANFYQFVLLAGGVLALAVVVYGGILYMTSVGNPSGMDEAKKWLEGALLGMLLLAGAYLLLKIINPQLVNVVLPTLQNTGQTANGVNTQTTSANGQPTNNAFTNVNGSATCNGAQCPSGQTCKSTQVSGKNGLITTTYACG